MTKQIENPETLVAIIVAARRSGNRDLERKAKRLLRSNFDVVLRFVAKPKASAWPKPRIDKRPEKAIAALNSNIERH